MPGNVPAGNVRIQTGLLYVLSVYYAVFSGNCLRRAIKNILGFRNQPGNFPGMKELAGLFEEAGLKNVKYHPFTGGVAATHIGWKR